eukprot:EG_transcript_2014
MGRHVTWLLALLLFGPFPLPWPSPTLLAAATADAQPPDLVLGAAGNASTYTFWPDGVRSFRLIQLLGTNTTLQGATPGLTVTTDNLYLSSAGVVVASGLRLIVQRVLVLAAPRVMLVDSACIVARSAATSVVVNALVVGASQGPGVVNEGTLQVLTGVTLTLQTPLLNTGTIQLVASSALVLGATAVLQGSLTLCSSCTLSVEMAAASSVVSIEDSATVSGDGQMAVRLGTMVVAGAVRVGQLAVGSQLAASPPVAFLQVHQPVTTAVAVTAGGRVFVDLEAVTATIVQGSLTVGSQGSVAAYNVGPAASTIPAVTGTVQLQGTMGVALVDGFALDLEPFNASLLQFGSRKGSEPFLTNLTYLSPTITAYYLQYTPSTLDLLLAPAVWYSPDVIVVAQSTAAVGSAAWLATLAAGLNTTAAHVLLLATQDGSPTKRLRLRFAASSDQKAYDLAQAFLLAVAAGGAYPTGLRILQAFWASADPGTATDDLESGAVLIFLIVLAAVCGAVLCALLVCWMGTRQWYRTQPAKPHLASVAAQVLHSSSFIDKEKAMIDDAMRTMTVRDWPPLPDLDEEDYDDDGLSVARTTVRKGAALSPRSHHPGPGSPWGAAPKLAAGEDFPWPGQSPQESFVFDAVDKPWQRQAHTGTLRSTTPLQPGFLPTGPFGPGLPPRYPAARHEVSWAERSAALRYGSPPGMFYMPYVPNLSASPPLSPQPNPLSRLALHPQGEEGAQALPLGAAMYVQAPPVMLEPPKQKSDSSRTTNEEEEEEEQSVHFLSPRSPQALRSHSSLEGPASAYDGSPLAARHANGDALSSDGSLCGAPSPGRDRTVLQDRVLLAGEQPELTTIRLRDLTSTKSLLDSNARFFSHLDAARPPGGSLGAAPYGAGPVVEVVERRQRLRTTTPVSPDRKGKSRARRYLPPPLDDEDGEVTFDAYVADPDGLPRASSSMYAHPYQSGPRPGRRPSRPSARAGGGALASGTYFD